MLEDVVVFGATVVAAGTAPVVVAFAGAAPLPVVVAEPVGLVPAGVGVAEVVGVEAGNAVIGVGSGGSGVDITVAIRLGKPVSVFSWRYLYQVVSSSIDSFLVAAYLGSVPASATARA